MRHIRIVIFAKAPKAGLAKTRLIPALGAVGAEKLALRLMENTLAQAVNARLGNVELCMTPAIDLAWEKVSIPAGVICTAQSDGDLGKKLASASNRVISDGESVILIGTDCPDLDTICLQKIALSLNEYDAVMVPATDGGYIALGLNQFHPLLFSGIAWGTDSVAFATLCRLGQLGWTVQQLPMLHDIDNPSDLQWLTTDWYEARRA